MLKSNRQTIMSYTIYRPKISPPKVRYSKTYFSPMLTKLSVSSRFQPAIWRFFHVESDSAVQNCQIIQPSVKFSVRKFKTTSGQLWAADRKCCEHVQRFMINAAERQPERSLNGRWDLSKTLTSLQIAITPRAFAG